jgi:adenosylmethionine-8-amino-7-oxononanoate aminotransferase
MATTSTFDNAQFFDSDLESNWSNRAKEHLWMHFSRMGAYEAGGSIPVIVKGEGAYIYDDRGKRYFDGISSLFATQVGHGREEIADAYAKQIKEIGYFPIWSYANPRAIELAERLTSFTPGDLNHVFKITGKPLKHKIISRHVAYHGTTQGALSITGIPAAKQFFEPLIAGHHKVPNTNFYRAPLNHRDSFEEFGQWAANRIEEAILFEGADTVAAVFIEPVQNSGGCFPPPVGYLQRVREICDQYDVILVCDETITGFGRIGEYFASTRYGIVPDIITCGKGMTSGYFPMGAMIANERLYEPFRTGTNSFLHGFTFGGHPAGAAVALANLDIFEREGINQNVRANEDALKATLEKLYDLPIVGDIRGAGYFYGIEMVKDKTTRETFSANESEKLLRGFLSKALFENGLYCRADDRGDPVIQIAPPLICDQSHFDEIESILRTVLTEASSLIL